MIYIEKEFLDIRLLCEIEINDVEYKLLLRTFGTSNVCGSPCWLCGQSENPWQTTVGVFTLGDGSDALEKK